MRCHCRGVKSTTHSQPITSSAEDDSLDFKTVETNSRDPEGIRLHYPLSTEASDCRESARG